MLKAILVLALTLTSWVVAHAAEAAAAAPAIPFYLKVLGFFGAGALVWKLLQGSVPKLLAVLQPIALRGTDAFVALVLAYPLLRWLVLGNKDNFIKTVNALLDGLEAISNAVQARLKTDLDAAAAGQPLPPSPSPSPDLPKPPEEPNA